MRILLPLLLLLILIMTNVIFYLFSTYPMPGTILGALHKMISLNFNNSHMAYVLCCHHEMKKMRV